MAVSTVSSEEVLLPFSKLDALIQHVQHTQTHIWAEYAFKDHTLKSSRRA